MPRAHRHYVPGYIWHLTHRCHNREFLLKYSPDRSHWLDWLAKAVHRYHLSVLNYMVTCNHVHLLVQDTMNQSIARSMQLAAGRTAQDFNERRKRKGAFWEDRYHATAVQSGHHLRRCMLYIDLNMVRAGAVTHPADWLHCGFHELHSNRAGTRILDCDRLCALMGASNREQLKAISEAMLVNQEFAAEHQRQAFWSESIAVGNDEFVKGYSTALGNRIGARQVVDLDESGTLALQEPRASYSSIQSSHEMRTMDGDNCVPMDLDFDVLSD